jgi:hypothetical protein
MAIAPLFFFAIPLMLLLVAAAVFFARGKRIEHPTCPQCLYNVTGLESSICPECGANLDVIGVLQPRDVKPLGRLQWAIALTCIVLALGIFSTPIIVNAIPPRWVISGHHVLSSPSSGAYSRVSISCSHVFRKVEDAKAKILDIHLQIEDIKPNVESGFIRRSLMRADFDSMTCDCRDRQGSSLFSAPLRFDDSEPEGTIERWFNLNGIAINEAVRREIREIAKVLRDHHRITSPLPPGVMRSNQVFIGNLGMSSSLSSSTTNMGVFQHTTTTATSGRLNDPWPFRIVVFGWLALWAIAMLLVLALVGRRVRRRGSAPTIQLSSPVESNSA